jgi:hypothetical protein
MLNVSGASPTKRTHLHSKRPRRRLDRGVPSERRGIAFGMSVEMLDRVPWL